jgi:hypothetical protein
MSPLSPSILTPKNMIRLPTSLNPTGRIIFQDDFEAGANAHFNYEKAGDAGGSAVASSADERGFRGLYNLKITAPLGAGKYYRATKYFSVPVNLRLGLEFWFGGEGFNANSQYLNFAIEIIDEALDLHEARVRYDYANTKWQYLNAAAAYSDLPNGVQNLTQSSGTLFFNVKLIADFAAKKYVKLICANKVFDISTINYRFTSPDPDARKPIMLFDIRFFNADATNARALYIDDLILTDNE